MRDRKKCRHYSNPTAIQNRCIYCPEGFVDLTNPFTLDDYNP